MKLIQKYSKILTLVIVLLSNSNNVKAFDYRDIEVKLIGHRGASAYEPENTIPSFEMAANLGMWGVECDLYALRDGTLVIFHNTDVDRMTNGKGKIQSMSLTEVKSLNIDSGNNIKKYNKLKIPTLDEYLICCKKNDLVPVIEFKAINVINVKEIVDKIKDYGLEDRSIIISTSHEWIKHIRKYSSKIQFQYLSDISLESINLLKEYGNYGIDVKYDRLSLDAVKLAHENGAVVNVWNVNTKEEADRVISMGVDMITSDYKLK